MEDYRHESEIAESDRMGTTTTFDSPAVDAKVFIGFDQITLTRMAMILSRTAIDESVF